MARGYPPLWAEQHFTEGKARAQLEQARMTVFMVLRARGLEPKPLEVARVEACTDLEYLREWASAAVTATATSDVFGKW